MVDAHVGDDRDLGRRRRWSRPRCRRGPTSTTATSTATSANHAKRGGGQDLEVARRARRGAPRRRRDLRRARRSSVVVGDRLAVPRDALVDALEVRARVRARPSSPVASSSAVVMRAADVLPLVPGEVDRPGTRAGASRAARSAPGCARASAQSPPRPRRAATPDAGLEVDVAVEPGQRASARSSRRSGRRRAASSTSTASSSASTQLERRRRHARRRARRRARGLERARAARPVSCTTTASTVGAHRPLAPRVFALRISPSTSAATANTARVAVRDRRARRPSGHGARWTEPSCHHDHTSSVTNGRNGANSRSSVESASASAARAEPRPSSPRRRRRGPSPARGSRRRSPRRTARCARARGRSRSSSKAVGRVVDELARGVASIDRSSGSVTVARSGVVAQTPSANFDALSSLMARRRPTFIWPSSNAVSMPGRPLAAQ